MLNRQDVSEKEDKSYLLFLSGTSFRNRQGSLTGVYSVSDYSFTFNQEHEQFSLF